MRNLGGDARHSWHPLIGASALLTALTVLLTWPQVLHLGTKVASHDDPFFSIWRLAWVAHILPTQPLHLFDANIFSPHLRTLAYSDAMLFEALLAAPWLWLQVNPILVYNLLLLTGIVSSGVGMFVLARHLTGDLDAALVSAVVFTLVPYRVDHFMHLELQWTVWMPLALWAVHRTVEHGSMRFGLLTGVLLWLQIVSSVYYGVFLGVIVAALAILLLVSQPRLARGAIAPLGLGAVVAAVLTLPYAWPYIENARMLGPREAFEVTSFSARLDSFFLAPTENWFWGWTDVKPDNHEVHLFPGVAAIGLGLMALVQPRRRHVWTYWALVALAAALSLGSNGPVYRWLSAHVSFFGGFRAPARFAILASCALSVLAGFGFLALRRLVSPPPVRRGLLVAVLVVLGLESGSAPLALADIPSEPPDVYRFLRTVDRSVLIELPMADYDVTPLFMYGSIFHWHPLVNGYSGYAPPDYRETRRRMLTFPDDRAIARLHELDVRYVLVHQGFYKNEEYRNLMDRILRRSDLVPIGRYRDWVSDTQIFELLRR